MGALLEHPELRVRHEDDVFNLLTKVDPCVAKEGDLWASVRFEFLSTDCVIRAERLVKEDARDVPCAMLFHAWLARRAKAAPSRGAKLDDQDTVDSNLKRMLSEVGAVSSTTAEPGII